MTVYLQDPDVTLLHGDVLEQLATLPAESVHCVVTSPPYWGLRDYGTGSWAGGNPDCDHLGEPFRTKAQINANCGTGTDRKNTEGRQPMGDVCGKCGAQRTDQQLGLEPTPDLYVARMVEVFREVRRVLRRDGTCWLNIADSYASEPFPPWGVKPKDEVGVPDELKRALRIDGWYTRSTVIWSKLNPMPESVTDRPTKSHEYVFLLTRSPRYFFDQEAVREPNSSPEQLAHNLRYAQPYAVADCQVPNRDSGEQAKRHATTVTGRNVRSVWEIATQPYPEAHFATFPEELARRCILAGTSERGCCPVCGAPWVRETSTSYERSPVHDAGSVVGRHYETGSNNFDGAGMPRLNKVTETLGWRPSCFCGHERGPGGEFGGGGPRNPIPCSVLDQFVGSGTIPHVARKHGRHAIGVDLNLEYLRQAAKRLGDPDAEQEIALAKQADAQLNLLARLEC